MSFLLQEERENSGPVSHSPFHRLGTGGIPESENDSDSGQIPVSRTPTITSEVSSLSPEARPSPATSRPRNSGVRVVWRV